MFGRHVFSSVRVRVCCVPCRFLLRRELCDPYHMPCRSHMRSWRGNLYTVSRRQLLRDDWVVDAHAHVPGRFLLRFGMLGPCGMPCGLQMHNAGCREDIMRCRIHVPSTIDGADGVVYCRLLFDLFIYPVFIN